jgi:hypothetical protein
MSPVSSEEHSHLQVSKCHQAEPPSIHKFSRETGTPIKHTSLPNPDNDGTDVLPYFSFFDSCHTAYQITSGTPKRKKPKNSPVLFTPCGKKPKTVRKSGIKKEWWRVSGQQGSVRRRPQSWIVGKERPTLWTETQKEENSQREVAAPQSNPGSKTRTNFY